MLHHNHQQKLQVTLSGKQDAFFIKSYIPIDYQTLSIDLLNAYGDETTVSLDVESHTNDSIEVRWLGRLKGIFQLRLKDKNSYFLKKIIIQ